MQVPAWSKVTVDPVTLHWSGVVEVKVTGLPESPPVATRSWLLPRADSAGSVKLIAWVALATVTARVAVGAAR